MHMPLVLTNRRRRGGSASAPAFSPSSLYSSGAQGIWLDPSDLSTMFSDRAGTTAMTTPGTVVGLRLDKSKGLVLGSELVVNGDFATDTWWTKGAGCTISGGVGVATAAASGSGLYRTGFLTSGSYYEITFTVVSVSAGGFRVGFFSSTYSATRTAPGTYTVRLRADSTGFVVETVGTTTGTVDNVSVKLITGNHAVAPTDAARPIYGVEPKGGRRNLLTWSEDLTNAIWSLTSVTKNSATRFTALAQSNAHLVVQSFPCVSGTAYAGQAVLRYVNNQYVSLRLSAGVSPHVTFDLVNGTVAGTQSGASGAILDLGDGSYLCSITATSTSTGTGNFGFFLQPSATNYGGVWLAAGTEAVDVLRSQLELGSTATAYQRVLSSYDITESGVATCHYVQYDGSDDSLSTSAIDFTATDKMSVFAGVRKLSDAASGMLAEFGNFATPTNGSWRVSAPITGGAADYSFASRFSSSAVATYTSASVAAPNSSVLSGLADISGDLATLRINGVQRAQSTDDQGTGNFGNHTLFIGRRNNATLPFNGRDYGLIVVGKAASAGEITDTETWLAAKTSGVTI